jgi:hypothetical protein
MKYNVAEWFLNTTTKLSAVKNQSIMKLMIAKLAKNGFAINIANTFQNTIGNMFAVKKTAIQLAHNNKG